MLDITFIDKHNAQCCNFFLADNFSKKDQNTHCKSLVACEKVYQLLVHGRWFSPGTPASSTTNTGRHDIAQILLKVALKHQKSIKSDEYCMKKCKHTD
jgi:hypothetical protein